MSEFQSGDNIQPPLSPSRRVRNALGAKRLAALCDRSTEAVRKWDRGVSKGGTGGLIPAPFQARILREIEAEGLPLTARDLIADPLP
ncbi:hypothetical protein [Phenylobacterium sp.]|uniref:hypothetical protein n=1 Tax=Phenylobacterium sp. TaxID=1871053 RepID=UPI0035AE9997